MASTLLFDLFGVIARHQSAAGCTHIEQVAGASGPAFWQAYWALRPPYDRGEQRGPAYWRAVAAELGRTFTDQQISDLVVADVDSWSDVDDEMVTLVKGLGAHGVRLGLLSNIPEELAAHYEERHQWLDTFSVRALSCRIGHAKPDASAYMWCSQALNRQPHEVLFIDDRVENVAAAEAVGMRGHLFTSPTSLRAALVGRLSP